MPYNANIPQPNDRISASQAQILGNFTQLQVDFGIDHITYNAAANVGKHAKITFPVLGGPPAFPGNEFGLYSVANAATGRAELDIIDPAGQRVSMTASHVGGGVNGYTIFPSGLIIKFGYTIIPGGGPHPGNETQLFTDAFVPTRLGPAFVFPPYFVAAPWAPAAGGAALFASFTTSPVVNQVVIYLKDDAGAAIGGRVYWMAIGR